MNQLDTAESGIRQTKEGALFDALSDEWTFRDATATISIKFASLNAETELRRSVKSVVTWYMENKASATATINFGALKAFLAIFSEQQSEITAAALLSYRSHLGEDSQGQFGRLATIIRRWSQLGYGGISDDAIILLNNIRARGGVKGTAVTTMDPVRGPFTDIEFEALSVGLEEALETGEVDDEDYLLCRVSMLFGRRPVQYAALKVCDLSRSERCDDGFEYVLRLPRGKQRNNLTRASFKFEIINEIVGSRLYDHCQTLRHELSEEFEDTDEIPMFPARIRDYEEPPGFKLHRTGASVTLAIQHCLNRLTVRSERTGDVIRTSPQRFRRSLGTRAAVEGHPPTVIAELLDHSDLQNVGVYVASVPELVERIDRAMAMRLAPLAQAFKGVLIEDESKALRANDPSSRICSPEVDSDMRPMGSCGKFGFCGLFAPLACYTCRNFQPWLDGPHESMLQHLLIERDRVVKLSDLRIASIHDRTILAVAEVIRLCEDKRKLKLENSDG